MLNCSPTIQHEQKVCSRNFLDVDANAKFWETKSKPYAVREDVEVFKQGIMWSYQNDRTHGVYSETRKD